MKRDIHLVQKILLLIIGILSIMLMAVLILKVHELHQEKLQREEWEVRHVEVQAEVDDVRMKIQELSEDGEALQEFLEESLKQEDEGTEQEEITEPEVVMEPGSETGQGDETEPEYGQEGEPVSGSQEAESGETSADGEWEGMTQSGDAILIDIPEMALPQPPAEQENTVSGNGEVQMPEEDTVSGNDTVQVPEEDTVSGNAPGTAAAQNPYETISGNAVVDGKVIPFQYDEAELTLEARRNIRSSYAETEQMNGEDKYIISNSTYDFSHIKIACLGDSITEGSNLNKLENYQQYSYPSVLKNILKAEEVYNLGIGGSSYGRYWDQAFVDRYKEIPEDTDIILVMGGTNDGFAASEKELGSLAEKKPRTFYGDVDELMRGLRENYPEAKIIFATPLPNVLHDYLRKQRDYLLPQSTFAKAVKELAAQYDIDVIDLYNSNLLDTHDVQIISMYMPDGVHGNPAGYQILAEHMASRIIQIVEEDALENPAEDVMEEPSVSGNSVETDGIVIDESVSGNSTDIRQEESVSGNGTGIPHMQDGKWIEEEIMSEEERAQEAQKAEENSQKAAQEAVVVDPAANAGTAPEESREGGQAEVQEPEEAPVIDYEYDGEAIVIQ